MFSELDADQTGVLRPAELCEAYKRLGITIDIQDAINIVNEVGVIWAGWVGEPGGCVGCEMDWEYEILVRD